MKAKKNIAIVGGGASGLFCAIYLQQNGFNVTIFEKEKKIARKILQSGNGKCNFTNENIDASFYNTSKIANILKSFSTTKCLEEFKKLGLFYKKDDVGRYYPYSLKSSTVVDVLMHHIKKLEIEVLLDTQIKTITYKQEFVLSDQRNKLYYFDKVIVATGGIASITDKYYGYEIAKSFNHHIHELRAGLVALKTKENVKPLSGIKVQANVSLVCNDKNVFSTSGEILFKDEGLSGIAIMEASRYFQKGLKNYISIDLVPNLSLQQLQKDLGELFKKYNNLSEILLGYFPKMINLDLLKRTKDIFDLAKTIKDYRFEVIDTYSFTNAQITRGGINLDEVNLDTLESKKISNLYFTGEILDVDGTCGGYNLHFAWASGFIVAQGIITEEEKKSEFTK